MDRLVTLLVPFVIRTIMIKTLGPEYLGLSNLFASILTVLSLAELGVGSAMVYAITDRWRRMTKPPSRRC